MDSMRTHEVWLIYWGVDMGKLYVVRHGEINFNVQGRYAGSTDVDLNEMGKNQAKIIREHLIKPIVVLDEFVERNLGVYEGLTRDEVSKKFPYPQKWKKIRNCPDITIYLGKVARQWIKIINNQNMNNVI